MGLLYKLRLNLARNGKVKLEDLPTSYKFDEKFVEASLEGGGYTQFKFASEWLRSDAEFILKMVKKYPKILEDCSDIIFDRYIDESGILVEKEMDKLFFGTLCCNEDINSFIYLEDKVANDYFRALKESRTIEGEYHGKKKSIKLVNNEFTIRRLLEIRYGIIKLWDLIGSI